MVTRAVTCAAALGACHWNALLHTIVNALLHTLVTRVVCPGPCGQTTLVHDPGQTTLVCSIQVCLRACVRTP